MPSLEGGLKPFSMAVTVKVFYLKGILRRRLKNPPTTNTPPGTWLLSKGALSAYSPGLRP